MNTILLSRLEERRIETMHLYHQIASEEVEAGKIALQLLLNHQLNARRILASNGITIEPEVAQAEVRSASSSNGKIFIPEGYTGEPAFMLSYFYFSLYL